MELQGRCGRTGEVALLQEEGQSMVTMTQLISPGAGALAGLVVTAVTVVVVVEEAQGCWRVGRATAVATTCGQVHPGDRNRPNQLPHPHPHQPQLQLSRRHPASLLHWRCRDTNGNGRLIPFHLTLPPVLVPLARLRLTPLLLTQPPGGSRQGRRCWRHTSRRSQAQRRPTPGGG